MVETIKAGERQLNDVFCDKFQFEIPPYQRPYAWSTSEAGTLLDDLLDACDGNQKVSELAPYFLGVSFSSNVRKAQGQRSSTDSNDLQL